MPEKSTSRFKALPPGEVEVCKRVGNARRFERLSQADLAEEVGLTRSQLANIESARVPLRFWTGWRICAALEVNQLWLITGRGMVRPFFHLDLSKYQNVLTEQTLFRDACNGPLLPRLETFIKLREAVAGTDRAIDKVALQYEETIESVREIDFAKVPTEKMPALIMEIVGHFVDLRRWGGPYDPKIVQAIIRTCLIQLDDAEMVGFLDKAMASLTAFSRKNKEKSPQPIAPKKKLAI